MTETEPGFSESVPTEAVPADSASAETVLPEPAPAEPASTEPAQVDVAAAEAAQVEAPQVEAAQVEAARIDAERSDAERSERAARRSRVRRNILRWTGAIVLVLAVGGGVAYAVSLPQRTDIPGLRTASDGRYDFPTLTLPTLPAGQPAPSASANSTAQQHLADIRQLLLLHPIDATLPAKASGWFADPYTLFSYSGTKSMFAQYGLRHTATTTWTTGDGATTTIYLLQFPDGPAADNASSKLSLQKAATSNSFSGALKGVPDGAIATTVTPSTAASGDYSVVKSSGKITRYGAFVSGDVFALVIQSGPESLPTAPFLQTLDLQAELLE